MSASWTVAEWGVAAAAAGVGGCLLARALRPVAFDWAGKVVLVTGGSRGLGLEMARELAQRRATLAVCGRDEAALDRSCAELAARGVRVLGVPCDVSQEDEVLALVAEVERRLGPVDVLVNNAGVIAVGPEETMTLGDYHEAMGVNFWGPLHCIRAVLPGMRRRRAGRIVNVASIGGKVSIPHLLPYSASKFALVGLSEGLRAELAPAGVVVTTACPGLMRTGSPRNATFKGQHRAEYAWFSLSDSLPLVSMDSRSAARAILAACARGDGELVLSLPAKAAALLHDLAPGFTADLLGLVQRLLPGPGGRGSAGTPGRDSESAVSPSLLTRLGDQAAARNNQFAPGEPAPGAPVAAGR